MLAVCEHSSPLGREVAGGGYGEVIPPGDAAMLAWVLVRWRQDPSLLNSMSGRALQRAPEFHRDRVLSVYEHELISLAPRPLRPAPAPWPRSIWQIKTLNN